jgi:hypothetical protein
MVKRQAWEWLFSGPCGVQRRDVFRWWEERRGRYNLFVGITGVISWVLILVAGSAAVKPGVDFEEPLAMIFGPPVYALLANFCYSLGPLLDVAAYRGRPRRSLFKAGLFFSVALTSLPGLWAVTAWLMTLYSGKKLD